jgi:hypothetical protein
MRRTTPLSSSSTDGPDPSDFLAPVASLLDELGVDRVITGRPRDREDVDSILAGDGRGQIGRSPVAARVVPWSR